MNRNSLMETAGRGMHPIQRVTINKSNDSSMMQEMHFDGMNSEGRSGTERVQPFGFSSVPLPRDEQSGGDSGGGGGSGGGEGGSSDSDKGKAAEGIVVYPGGQRNHPVMIAMDDRRHRPIGLKPGENAQYDHNGQMTLVRSTGVYLLSLDDEQKSSGGSGGGSGGGGQQQQKERMVSLRHVNKKKQERGQQSASASGSGGQSGGQGKPQDYKHEGESVNTELRVIKNKIEFRTGDTVVADHTKDTSKWDFKGKEHTVSSTDKHTVQTKEVSINGDNSVGVQGKQVNINGSQGIAMSGPTTLNGQPVATTDMIASLSARLTALGG